MEFNMHHHKEGLRRPWWGTLRPLAAVLVMLLAGGLACAQAPAASAGLHALIRAGDVQAVREWLTAGAAIDVRDSWGRTPLIVALQQGKTTIAELLIERGANIAITDAWGRTPLLVATQLKNTAAVRLLLSRGADVNAANKNDITPLIAAAQTGNVEAASLLLAAGAAPDRTDNLGWTALMWAANRNDATMIRLLVERGAQAGITGLDRSTALELARQRGADNAVLMLLVGKADAQAPAAAGAVPARRALAAPLPAERMPVIDPRRIVRGQPDAPVTLVEYTDFQCPYCGAGARTVEEVLARYEGQVRLVVKHAPLQFHPMARPAAQYFEALALQSPARAWAFYDRLFANPDALGGGEAFLRRLAGDLGADLQQLDKDLTGPVVRERLAADMKEVERYQFDGVPAFIANGQVIEGAQPAQVFVDVIDALLHR
jgi:protein-disulfide isomerase